MCPHCEKGTFAIDHLKAIGNGISFGPWYCNECGGSFDGRISADGNIDVRLRTERRIKTYDLLMLSPQDKPVWFIVEGLRFEDPAKPRDETSEAEHKEYFYEEHSCPTNWLKPEIVYYDGDDDPHGLLEFVTYADASAADKIDWAALIAFESMKQ